MIVKRERLLSDLTAAQSGLAAKELIEQTTCFVFSKNGRVFAYNDEVAVSKQTEFKGVGAVQAKELLSLLRLLHDDEVDISTTDSEMLIKSRRSEAALRLTMEISLPTDVIDEVLKEKKKWTRLPSNFNQAIQISMMTAGHSYSHPALSCVHVTSQFAESCDNFRLTRYTLKDEVPNLELLIPAHSARELVKHDVKSLCITQGWANFKTEDGDKNQPDLIFSCRTISHAYPNLNEFLQVDGQPIRFPTDLADALNRARIFANTDSAMDQDARTTIRIADHWIVVSGEGDAGRFSEKVRIKYDGEPIEFVANPSILAKILPILTRAVVGASRIKFIGAEFSHAICLVQADSPQPSKKKSNDDDGENE